MNFLKKSLKVIVVGLVFCAIGLSVGLVILHYREKKKLLNPFEQGGRDWARKKLHLAAGSARERLLNTRQDLEAWFEKRREDIPDTRDLLDRAIAYLEEEDAVTTDATAGTEPAPAPGTGVEPAPAAPPAPAEPAAVKAVPAPAPGPAYVPRRETPPPPAAPAPIPAPETAPETPGPAVDEAAEADAEPLDAGPEPAGAAPVAPAAAVAKPSPEERTRIIASAEAHLRKGKRYCLGAMPGRPNAEEQAGKARSELDAAAGLLSGYLQAEPEDHDAQKMLSEVRRYRDSLPEMEAAPRTAAAGIEVASLPDDVGEPEAAPAPAARPADTRRDDVALTRDALDAVVGVDGGSRTREKEDFDRGKEHFRQGLEHYRRSAPGKPDWLLHLKRATPEFEKAQALMQDYADDHPDDKEAQDLFLDVNRFLYDCYKRTPLDLKR